MSPTAQLHAKDVEKPAQGIEHSTPTTTAEASPQPKPSEHPPTQAAPASLPTVSNHDGPKPDPSPSPAQATLGSPPSNHVPATPPTSPSLEPSPQQPLPPYPAQPATPTATPNQPIADLSLLPVPAADGFSAPHTNLIHQAVADSGLTMAVFPHAAHVSLVSDDGDLSLHVRVRDGSAEVNVSGTMAPLFESKGPEVRTILAGEGLGLGSFATDQQGGHQHSQQGTGSGADFHPYPSSPKHQAASPASPIVANDENHIHVTA
jgi:hypothetical protein